MMNKKEQKLKRRRNRQYDSEFKKNALQLVENGRSVPAVAEALGIDKSLIYTWRRQANPLGEEQEAELRENDLLRNRILELEQERDILKKALAIFSRKAES